MSSPTRCPVRFATMSATRRQRAGVRCAVGQDHAALTLASLAIASAALVAYSGPRRWPTPVGGPRAALEPSQPADKERYQVQ